MIVFVLVSAALNIALGYGLAVYLTHGCWPWRRPAPAEALSEVFDAAESFPPEPEPDPEPVPEPIAAVSEPAPVAPFIQPVSMPAVDPAATLEPPPQSPDLEKEMLAGIEEFRNQLAQMKAQTTDDDEAGLAEIDEMASL